MCLSIFRTITFVICVGLRFNNMSPNKQEFTIQVKAYKHKLFLLFFLWPYICTFHLLTTTAIALYIPCCFVCKHAHRHTLTLIWRKKSSATKVRVSTSVNELLSKCQQVLWPSKKYKIYRGVRQIVFEWWMVYKRAFQYGKHYRKTACK